MLVGSLPASAQNVPRKSDRQESLERRNLVDSVLARARQIRPQRRDSPLRYLNISDEEIRDLQTIAAQYIPGAMVNISPVVTGCPCEEGPHCTDQVYLVAIASNNSVEAQLSHVKGVWKVGAVQEWWWRYQGLQAKGATMSGEEFEGKLDLLARDFPKCANLTQTADIPDPSAGKVKQ